MFDPAPIQALAGTHRETLRRLAEIETGLSGRFHRLDTAVQALCLSALAGEPLLFVGPPGTGKSRLIRAFCEACGLHTAATDGDRIDYFEYLLTPFTEPSELFGYYDIGRLQQGELVRMNEGRMMQNARVVYLDEVFNGSSAILNTILSFLNERVFHDRGLPRPVRMEFLFASTNAVPETPELRAVHDRFLLRCRLDNVAPDPAEVGALLEAGWRDTYALPEEAQAGGDLLQAFDHFRKDLRTAVSRGALSPRPDHPFLQGLAHFVQTARQYDLSAVSNRRLVKLSHMLAVHRIWRHAADPDRYGPEIDGEDLALFPTLFLDRDDPEIQDKMAAWARQWQPGGSRTAPPPTPATPPPVQPR